MAQVQVRDRSIWTSHIHGDRRLVERLDALEAGDTVSLRVNGRTGLWEKMRDTKGRATPGLKPVGEISEHWRSLFEARRGELVEIAEETSDGWHTASSAERDAAWNAFLALTRAGWRSAVAHGDRDELHERR